MIERVEQRVALKANKLIGDTAHGTAEFLAWMVEHKGIEPHVPVWEKAERKDGTFSRSGFRNDAVNDADTRPVGKRLKQYRTRGWQARNSTNQDPTLRVAWCGQWPGHRRTGKRGASANRWKCCSSTSSGG